MIERPSSGPWFDTPLARWLAAVAWMALIFALSAQSHLPSAPQPLLDLLLKKGAHFSAYGILATLLWRALQWRPPARGWAWLLAVLYAVSDEWHQSFVALRHPQATDVLIDGCGAATALVIAALVVRRIGSQESKGLSEKPPPRH